MAERELIDKILMAASRLGARLFRVNTALAWTGEVQRSNGSGKQAVFLGPRDVVIRNARPLHAGLVKGGADTIGWTPVEIKPEHVGRKVAVFTALECKTGKLKLTDEQAKFLAAVEAAGGIARVARDPADIDGGLLPWGTS